MLKPLLFILVIVILIALALNFDLFTDAKTTPKPTETLITKVVVNPQNESTIVMLNTASIIVDESNLSKELQELLNEAAKLLKKHRESEAILLYEEIIAKSKKSNDIKVLKLFAKACFNKANIHYAYPNYDIDSTIESYELIIESFKDRYNKGLLITYMEAKLQLSIFNSKEEIIVTYDELIEKFQNDKEKRFEKEIEELLFSKSFALMGVNDEEAIEVLDSIIAKYTDKNNLPDTVKNSILNNIELSIITANDTEKYVDLANQYMANSPDTKPLLDMLSIIKNAQDLEQSEALEEWNNKHNQYKFPDWDFSELRKWVNKMETPEAQKRIRQYLDIFEKQKYKNMYQPSTNITPTSQDYSDSSTQNTNSEPSAINEDEVEYEEVIPVYEPDPYLNDIVNTEAEISYPNPYSTYEPNLQTDGASHTYEGNNY